MDMALTSMKRTPKEMSDEVADVGYTPPEYPWGLQITLEDEDLTKLGIDELPKVGATVAIMAEAKVSSVSAYDSENGKSRSVSLQITDLSVGEPQEESLASALYKE